MTFQIGRCLVLISIPLLLSGCMIPLPPHRLSTERKSISFRNNAEGHCTHRIIEERKLFHGRWLLNHHGRFFEKWEATWFRSYGITNEMESAWNKLGFLDHQSEEPWKIFAVKNSKSWLAHRTLDWSPNGSTESIIVFNDFGEWHRHTMSSVKDFTVWNDGQEIRIQTVGGTQTYQVLNNQLRPVERDFSK
jgi:hypothetical protein